MSKYLSRKFIAAGVVIVVASAALFAGRMSGTEWLASANVALGLYLGANVAQKGVVGNAQIPPQG